MAANRIAYGLLLTAAILGWLLWGTGFSFLWLLCLVLAPWVSLIVSLRAMGDFRMRPRGQRVALQGRCAQVVLLGTCRYPMPPFRGRLRLVDSMTGKKQWYDPARGIPTEHCGGWRVELRRGRVCEYFGILSWPVRGPELQLTVLPKPLTAGKTPEAIRQGVIAWQPKPWGPGEHYELRPYRTGDSPRSLHWKLSYKTGKPIIRQVQQPIPVPVTVEMISGGSRDSLDRKYARLLWVCSTLLEEGQAFRLRVLTGSGIRVLPIGSQTALQRAVCGLLCQPCARPDAAMEKTAGSVLSITEEETWGYSKQS